MSTTHPPGGGTTGRHPVHALIASFPVVCFTLALLTDIAFWQTSNLMWQNFSAWLLFAGLVFGGLAIVTGIVDFAVRRWDREGAPAWLHVIGTLLVLLLAFINSLVHAGDGWTAVVPYGLALSAATVLLMLATAFTARPKPQLFETDRDV